MNDMKTPNIADLIGRNTPSDIRGWYDLGLLVDKIPLDSVRSALRQADDAVVALDELRMTLNDLADSHEQRAMAVRKIAQALWEMMEGTERPED
ncbi:MAG: hypothetical protein CMK33_07125 [Porticoccaceae bacterium]|nr:hypothetical protein [Porticoccaceae bacterium]